MPEHLDTLIWVAGVKPALDRLIEDNFSAKERAEIRLKSKEKIASIRLQQVRKSHHKTQKELAQVMGLSQSALSELEKKTKYNYKYHATVYRSLGR